MMNLRKIFVCLSLISILLTPFNVFAEDETLGDLRRKYEALLAEKQENDNKTAAAKAAIEQKQRETKQAEADLSAAQIEERQTQEAIEASNQKIETLKGEAEKVLVYMQQMQGQNAYVEYVTGASSMTDLITRIEAVKQVTDYIQDTVNNLEAEIKENERLKDELVEKQKKLAAQIESYKATIQKYYANLDEYDKFADSIEDKVESARKYYEDYKDICKRNLNRTDDDALLSECSQVPVNSGWMKPLEKGYVTSTIGSRWGSYHNALDIGGNNEGTPVYAAAAGRVAGINWKTSCGGNRVFINTTVNGEKYTYFYYHLLKINVSVGDIVDQNTVVGTVGGYSTSTAHGGYDSCTTGMHLHFGIAYGWFNSHVGKGHVMESLPGFGNYEGYRFYSRLDYYGN